MHWLKKAVIIFLAVSTVFCYFLYGPFAYTISELAIHFVDNANEPCMYFCEDYIAQNEQLQQCCTLDSQPTCVEYAYCENNKQLLRTELVKWGHTGLIVTIAGGVVIGIVSMYLLHVSLMRHNRCYERCCGAMIGCFPCCRRNNLDRVDETSLLASHNVSDTSSDTGRNFTTSDTTCSICHD